VARGCRESGGHQNLQSLKIFVILFVLAFVSTLRRKAVFRIHLRDFEVTSLIITEFLRLSSRGE